jgi:hypothetical protein
VVDLEKIGSGLPLLPVIFFGEMYPLYPEISNEILLENRDDQLDDGNDTKDKRLVSIS